MVLHITNAVSEDPIRVVEDGSARDNGWISTDGVSYTLLSTADEIPKDLAQHLLLGSLAPEMQMDVYVDPAHVGHELGTAENPFTSIAAALPYVMESGTLHIAPNTYEGQTASLDSPMTLVSEGSGTVTLR